MATLAFGGPVFDEASNRVVVRDHVDRPRVGPMPPGEARLAAAPSTGVARVAVGRLMDWLAVVLVAIRHRLVALGAPSLQAMTVARQSRSRTEGGSGRRHIVTALSLDDDRLSQW